MRRRKISLRNLLLVWFIMFSIVPLSFVTGYSLVKYEEAIDDELGKRLEGNARELGVVLSDLENSYLMNFGRLHASDVDLVRALTDGTRPDAKRIVSSWMKNYAATSISIFDGEGERIFRLQRSGGGDAVEQKLEGGAQVFLASRILEELKNKAQIRFRDVRPKTGLELAVYTKITGRSGRVLGILEEIILIEEQFLKEQKRRLKLELVMLDSTGVVSVTSNQDFFLLPEKFFAAYMDLKKGANAFDLPVRDEPYGFIVRPLFGDTSDVYLALGTSKKEVKSVTRRITIALFTACGAVVLLLFPILWGTSFYVLRPLENLVEAAHKIAVGEDVRRLPVESATEIGQLTESFNQMSQRVTQARRDLEKKVGELEAANTELQRTQSQLVHSAKMVSLGQLVAGVAHELNNPIGYIYSNMAHLKEYAEKLIHLVSVAEKSPEKLTEEKEKSDYNYIVEDMPKLIKSCEDGALRTRDIVLGLRNFSRIDEAQLKEVNVAETIRNTLQLLTGEMKMRIQVHTDFGDIPDVRCFASQLNQVFMNILTNAAQAIEGKGDIWVRTWVEGPQVFISIRDSGKGISAEVREKIFDPFFTTKPVGQGTGLGLSISYGIIKKHGGEIEVLSEPGRGTEFIIRLPLRGPSLEQA